MPKVRTKEKHGGIKLTVQRKFRIGTRSGGQSALGMSTEALLSALVDPNQSRYVQKIKAVLAMRGVPATS